MESIKPTMRFFTRFRGEYGRVRAVIRYGKTRKTLTTPYNIQRMQLCRFSTAGHVEAMTNNDLLLNSRLAHYTRHAWAVCMPLIESNTFASTTSAEIAEAIANSMAAEQRLHHMRLLAKQGYDIASMPEEGFAPGRHTADGLCDKEKGGSRG